MRRQLLFGAGSIALFANLASAQFTSSLFPMGTSNIFGAGGNGGGVPNPGGGGGGTPAPGVFFGPGYAGGTVKFLSVTSAWSCCSGGGTFNGPDGGPFAGGSTNINSVGSISGYKAPSTMMLVGVFVGAGVPSGPAPATLDFTSIGTGFTTLAPLVNQIFWVGDGLTGTGSGTVQEFMIPTGATRLFIGVADAFSFTGNAGFYNDNIGMLDVTARFDRPMAVVPEPATVSLMGIGLLGVGIAVRRRRG